MSEITSDSAVLAALRRQMTIAAAKQAVAASNLANVNTPGYKAQRGRLRRRARRASSARERCG